MSWKKDNPGSPCCSCECPCYPLDGNGRDYHRHLDLITSGTVAYSTVAKLGTKAAEFNGNGFLHQSQNRCYSIGNGLRMWGWFRLDGTQATKGFVQNIVSLGGVVSQSSAGAPVTMSGAGAVVYYNSSYAGGVPGSIQPGIAVQPSGTGAGTNIYGYAGAWPAPTPIWSFFHTTYSSTGTVTVSGTTSSASLTTWRGIKNPHFGTEKLFPVYIGGAPDDARHNAGSNTFGGSTTGTSTIRIDNVGFSKDIANYSAKAINLWNNRNGRACPAST